MLSISLSKARSRHRIAQRQDSCGAYRRGILRRAQASCVNLRLLVRRRFTDSLDQRVPDCQLRVLFRYAMSAEACGAPASHDRAVSCDFLPLRRKNFRLPSNLISFRRVCYEPMHEHANNLPTDHRRLSRRQDPIPNQPASLMQCARRRVSRARMALVGQELVASGQSGTIRFGPNLQYRN